MQINWRSLNLRRIAIICASVFVFGVLFGYVAFPQLLKKMIGGAIALKPGSMIRDLYTKVPFAVDFKIYLFNVTNREEVTMGKNAKLQEIGPYYFEEWKEKIDLEDDDVEDTLTYKMKNTFIFRPDLSGGLTGNEIVTTLHPLIMGMGLATNVDKKPMLGLVNRAINQIFHNPVDPFWTGRVMDLLFDGIDIDCSGTEFESKATCSVLGSDEVKAVRVVNETLYKFSMLASVNATALGTWKVFRGVKNFRDVGRMLMYNDEEETDAWGTEECNQFRGTDSTIFPPMLRKEDGLWAYEPSLCMSIGAFYVGQSKYAGIPTWEYTMTLGNAKKDESLHCYCMDPPLNCPRAGTRNMFNCVGSPLVISMPHYYDADPEILTHFDSGLNPNKNDHEVFIHFESISGGPLSAAKRLQFSMDVVPIPEVDCMKNMQSTLLPLFWVEESVSLNKTYTKVLKNQLFLMLKITSTLKWMCMVIGLVGCIVAAILHAKKQNEAVRVVPPIVPKSQNLESLSASQLQSATKPKNELKH